MKPSSGTRRDLIRHLTIAAAALPFASLLSPVTRGKDGRMRRVFITGSTDGLGRGRMNAVSLRTESFTAVDQPDSLFKSQTAVT